MNDRRQRARTHTSGRQPPDTLAGRIFGVFARSSLLCLLTAAALIGCSSSEAGSDPAEVVPVGARALQTDTRGEDAVAWQQFTIDCRMFVDNAGELGAELPLPGAATVTVTSGPAPPRHIDGTTVILGKVGTYEVACSIPTTGEVDPTPAILPVVPGAALPEGIRTRLWLHEPGLPIAELPDTPIPTLQAGATISVTCSGADKANNPIEQGWKLAAVGYVPEGITPGAPFTLTKVGKTGIRCGVGDIWGDPRSITITVGPPKHLHTDLAPDTIVAGNASELTCRATDAFDNPVADFPFSVNHSDKLTLKKLYLTATVAGVHAVKCVPESLAWKLFTIHHAMLTVQPGPPASVEVAKVPNQGVYKRKAKVRFHPLVKDEFGNVIGDAVLKMTIEKPAKGFKVLSDVQGNWDLQFMDDATYVIRFDLDGSPLSATTEVLVDGAPPVLTIDYPPWGSMLTAKPSIQLKGKAGDEGAGIKDLIVNKLKVYPDGADEWFLQVGAKHGLNPVFATATDIGGQQAKATRGFYYSEKYYPTDAKDPKAHLVPSGLQLFFGRDFFDDGDHNPNKPDDLATIIEVIMGGISLDQLLPANSNGGGADVSLSNAKMNKPTVAIELHDGGIQFRIRITKISVDVKVKAKVKLGPIKVSLGASGTFKIDNAEVETLINLGVSQGNATAQTIWTKTKIDGMKFSIDGLGGLFNPIVNLLLGTVKGDLEKALATELAKQLPGAFQALFGALAINDSFEIDPLVPGGKKKVTITLASVINKLQVTKQGVFGHLDIGFSSAKGIPHPTLGAIGRGGCVGVEPDKFHIDEKAKIQVAAHDDVLNQLLYAMWYGGALSGTIVPGTLDNATGAPAIPLETSTIIIDPLLPPILEGCPQVSAFNPTGTTPADFDPMRIRLQMGDAFGSIDIYSNELVKLYMAMTIELGITLKLGKDDKGNDAVIATPDKELFRMHEFVGLSEQLQEGKWAWIIATNSLIESLFGKGLQGLDKPIVVPLPATEIDLSTISPQIPKGTAIKVKVSDLQRKGGYGAFTFVLQ